MPDLTPDLTELRRLRDTEREELHSPTRRLDAYYYSFSETGSVPIDAILSAVAIAGKSCHNTDMWTEDDEWSRWGVGRSLVDVIQCAANEAADALLDAAAERDRLAEAVERVRALHGPRVLQVLGATCSAEECDHEDACPLVDYTVCGHCYDVGDGAHPYAYEEGGLQDVAHPCATYRALDATPETGCES